MARTVNLDRDFLRTMGREQRLNVHESFLSARGSPDDRLAEGKSLRKACPRSSHADYTPMPDGRDPVLSITEQNSTRIQSLVPLRNERMSASAFGFFRGSAVVMARDLAGTPRTGLEVMACGDAHIGNFGVFGTAERKLNFAINDFDEVQVGPWEWDLKRLVASAAIAARVAGGDIAAAWEAAHTAGQGYVQHLRTLARAGYLETWYTHFDEAAILTMMPPRHMRAAKQALHRARSRGHVRSFDRLTERTDSGRRLIDAPPLVVRLSETDDGLPIGEAMDRVLRSYVASLTEDRRRILSRYRLVDVARKVVGTGSIGLGCWVLYFQGRDESDPLFLQLKEARASVLAPYLGRRTPLANQGQRVVVGQRMIQGSPDIFLGWGPDNRAADRAFYIRQLADMKGGFQFDETSPMSTDGLLVHCRLCGMALALAHAKSGDAGLISGYCGTSDALPEAMARFALSYADQASRDHEAFVAALQGGRKREVGAAT